MAILQKEVVFMGSIASTLFNTVVVERFESLFKVFVAANKNTLHRQVDASQSDEGMCAERRELFDAWLFDDPANSALDSELVDILETLAGDLPGGWDAMQAHLDQLPQLIRHNVAIEVISPVELRWCRRL